MARLGESISALGVRVNDNLLGVTASMGIAELRAEETYSSTINRADFALLRASAAGATAASWPTDLPKTSLFLHKNDAPHASFWREGRHTLDSNRP